MHYFITDIIATLLQSGPSPREHVRHFVECCRNVCGRVCRGRGHPWLLWSDTVRIQSRTNCIIHKLSPVTVLSQLNPANWERIWSQAALLDCLIYIPFLFSRLLIDSHVCVGYEKPIIITDIDIESLLSFKFSAMVIILQAPCGNLCFEVPISLCHSSYPLDVFPPSRSIKL